MRWHVSRLPGPLMGRLLKLSLVYKWIPVNLNDKGNSAIGDSELASRPGRVEIPPSRSMLRKIGDNCRPDRPLGLYSD